jgi:hypothetical protein
VLRPRRGHAPYMLTVLSLQTRVYKGIPARSVRNALTFVLSGRGPFTHGRDNRLDGSVAGFPRRCSLPGFGGLSASNAYTPLRVFLTALKVGGMYRAVAC